jgi:hypothetical protein
MGHLEVVVLSEMSEIGTNQGADGFDDQEEDRIDCWQLEVWRRHGGLWTAVDDEMNFSLLLISDIKGPMKLKLVFLGRVIEGLK